MELKYFNIGIFYNSSLLWDTIFALPLYWKFFKDSLNSLLSSDTTQSIIQKVALQEIGGSVPRKHICGKTKLVSPHQHLWWKSPTSCSCKTLCVRCSLPDKKQVRRILIWNKKLIINEKMHFQPDYLVHCNYWIPKSNHLFQRLWSIILCWITIRTIKIFLYVWPWYYVKDKKWD
jgi:hypothetical protein